MPAHQSDDPQIRAIVRGVTQQTERTMRAITLHLAAELIRHTPVDTGWARANWVPRVGRPSDADVGRGGAERVPQAVAAQTAGRNAVLGYRLGQGNINVTNNVPYIEALNDGHSMQEPAGFVQRAIRSAVSSVAVT